MNFPENMICRVLADCFLCNGRLWLYSEALDLKHLGRYLIPTYRIWIVGHLSRL